MKTDMSDETRRYLEYRSLIGEFVLNRIKEEKNGVSGVIGYTLSLNAEETEKLITLICDGQPNI